MEIKEMLTRTSQCPACKGQGNIEDKGSTSGTKQCTNCYGSGIVLDNEITDLLISKGVKGKDLVEVAEGIFKHLENKLLDSYNRGLADGKAEVSSAKK